MQGLRWSVLLSVALTWSVSATGQISEPDPGISPYNSVGTSERVSSFFTFDTTDDPPSTRYRIHDPGASFIKVHFNQFNLPTGMAVVIHNPDGTELYRYSGTRRAAYTFDIEAGDDGNNGFSAMSISGDTAIVSLVGKLSRFSPAKHRLEIDSYVRGRSSKEHASESLVKKTKTGDQVSKLETTCGLEERFDAVCYKDSHPAEYGRSSPVVKVITSRGKECTAWRVGSDNRLFTAGHCISSQEDLDGSEFWFNYQAAACNGPQGGKEVKVTGGQLLANDHTFDYSLFTVNDFENISKYGYLGLDVRNGSIGEGIFIPQHGLGQPRQIALESDMNPGGLCQIDDTDHYGYAPGSDIGYFCDTTTSSSGSPVISSITGKVIALHHLGGCFNSGTKISRIWPQVSPHFDGVVPTADSAWDYEPVNQAPQADFDISCESLACDMDASTSTDPDGHLTGFSWSLGDGSNTSGMRVLHEFAEAGEYVITLEVEDDEGAIDVVERTVSVSAPNVEPEARFSSTCIATNCRFDASWSSDSDGSIVSWNWSFGDGRTAQGEVVEYSYQGAGTYTVRLTVKDDDGESDWRSTTIMLETVNRLPVANFSVTCDEQTCNFDANSSQDPDGAIVSFQWSFDDGSISSGVSAEHVFASAGNHSATLTVEDEQGAKSSRTRTFNITVSNENTVANENPVAKFIYFCSGKTCQMDAGSSSDGDDGISRYNWDFGDGISREGSMVIHEFERSGSYTVKLMVVDSSNSSAVQTQKIKIQPPELKLVGYGNLQSTRTMATVLWSGAESETVDIYRDGVLVVSTRNDGKFIDLDMGSKSKIVRYTLCESDSGRCSGDLVLKLQNSDPQMKIPAESAGISLLRNVRKGQVKFR